MFRAQRLVVLLPPSLPVILLPGQTRRRGSLHESSIAVVRETWDSENTSL